MNISGVIVRARPERRTEVQALLGQIPGAEVHQVSPDGRLVVTVEGESEGALADTLIRMESLPGVLAASLVYHRFEDDACIDEEVPDETDPA